MEIKRVMNLHPETIEEYMDGLPMCAGIIQELADGIVARDMEVEAAKRPHAVLRSCQEALVAATMPFMRYDRHAREKEEGYLAGDVAEAGVEPRAIGADNMMSEFKLK